jgi:phage terminase small subunit
MQLDELDDYTAASVASFEVQELFAGSGEERKLIGYTKKVKLWDKNAALDKLMRHLEAYKRDNEQKVDALTALLQQYWAQPLGIVNAIKQG